jgi:hypothetical protein
VSCRVLMTIRQPPNPSENPVLPPFLLCCAAAGLFYMTLINCTVIVPHDPD